MDIHSLDFAADAFHIREIFPPVAFVEGIMIGDEIKRLYPLFRHIARDEREQLSGDSAAAEFFLGENRADVRGKVAPLVEVVCDDPESPGDPVFRKREISLRDVRRKTLVHAVEIGISGNFPLFREPFRRAGKSSGWSDRRRNLITSSGSGILPAEFALESIKTSTACRRGRGSSAG